MVSMLVYAYIATGMPAPEFVLVPSGVMPTAQCEATAKSRNAEPWMKTDSKGRTVMFGEHRCVFFNEFDVEDYHKAMKTYGK